MRNRRIKKILGAMLAAAIVCQTSASPGVLTVRAETADSVTVDSSTADSSAADSAVDEQEQIRHGDMDEHTGAEEDVDVNQGVDVEAAIGGTEEKTADAAAESATEAEYRYISDMEYITDNRWSYAGWGNIMKDKNIEGGTISLLLDGSRVYFKKGMGAHATSQLTYDIFQRIRMSIHVLLRKWALMRNEAATERSGSESLSQRTGQTGRNYIRVRWLLPPVMRSRWI